MRKYGLKVFAAGGERVSFFRASLRHFAKVISTAPLLLGFLLTLHNPAERTVHDAITGTFVSEAPANLQSQPAAFGRLDRAEWTLAILGVGILFGTVATTIADNSADWTIERTLRAADVGQRAGRYEQAESLLLKAVNEAEKLGTGSDALLQPLDELARYYTDRQKYPQAEAVYKRLVPLSEQYSRPELLMCHLEQSAYCYYRDGRFTEAGPLYETALHMRKDMQPDEQGLNQDRQRLAYIKMQAGQYEEAEVLLKKAEAGWSNWTYDDQIREDKKEWAKDYAELQRRIKEKADKG